VPRLMRKSPKEPSLTRSEQKAAEIDQWVKGHLAESREKEKLKTARLKALREAREAALPERKPKARSPRATTGGKTSSAPMGLKSGRLGQSNDFTNR